MARWEFKLPDLGEGVARFHHAVGFEQRDRWHAEGAGHVSALQALAQLLIALPDRSLHVRERPAQRDDLFGPCADPGARSVGGGYGLACRSLS